VRELRLRTLAGQAGRKPSALGCSAQPNASGSSCAWPPGYGQPVKPGALAARRVRQAEHRAHRVLAQAGFADPAIAVAVLRQVQVLTMTATLASLDYRTADAARAAISSLIARPAAPRPAPDADDSPLGDTSGANQDAALVAAAARIVARSRRDGNRLSQVALGRELRGQGYTVANSRLRWLSTASGLVPRHDTEPNGQER
jgi:hypothetical protein